MDNLYYCVAAMLLILASGVTSQRKGTSEVSVTGAVDVRGSRPTSLGSRRGGRSSFNSIAPPVPLSNADNPSQNFALFPDFLGREKEFTDPTQAGNIPGQQSSVIFPPADIITGPDSSRNPPSLMREPVDLPVNFPLENFDIQNSIDNSNGFIPGRQSSTSTFRGPSPGLSSQENFGGNNMMNGLQNNQQLDFLNAFSSVPGPEFIQPPSLDSQPFQTQESALQSLNRNFQPQNNGFQGSDQNFQASGANPFGMNFGPQNFDMGFQNAESLFQPQPNFPSSSFDQGSNFDQPFPVPGIETRFDNMNQQAERQQPGRQTPPFFQQPQPTFPQREQSFRQPDQSFQQPELSFQQPEPSFQQPEPSFQQTQASFQQTQPSFQQSQPSFQQTQRSFQQSQQSFQQTQPWFQQMQPSFQQAQPSFQQTNNNLPLSRFDQLRSMAGPVHDPTMFFGLNDLFNLFTPGLLSNVLTRNMPDSASQAMSPSIFNGVPNLPPQNTFLSPSIPNQGVSGAGNSPTIPQTGNPAQNWNAAPSVDQTLPFGLDLLSPGSNQLPIGQQIQQQNNGRFSFVPFDDYLGWSGGLLFEEAQAQPVKVTKLSKTPAKKQEIVVTKESVRPVKIQKSFTNVIYPKEALKHNKQQSKDKKAF